MSTPTATGPLAGIRVIELGQVIAGPFCGQLLGDLGADVIKVEAPGTGDVLRQWGPGDAASGSVWWQVAGRNKRSVTIDLRVAEGQRLASLLAAEADILDRELPPGNAREVGPRLGAAARDQPRTHSRTGQRLRADGSVRDIAGRCGRRGGDGRVAITGRIPRPPARGGSG